MNQWRTGELPYRVKLGYGMGHFGEGIAYSFFYYFYTYFLVTVVGLSPGTAGTLSAFAVVWDAITDPLCGYLSDRSRHPIGRRRSFIAKAAVPLGVMVALLCWKPHLTGNALVIYLVLTNILFWIFFTACDIPWIILGNELTDDFDEKTRLRSISTALMMLGTVIASGFSLPAVSFLANWLGSDVSGWGIWGLVLGLLSSFGFLISVWATRGRDKLPVQAAERAPTQKGGPKQFFRIAVRCWRVKGYLPLLALTLCATAASGVFCSGSIFLMTTAYGMSERQASLFNTVTSILAFVLVPIIGWFATKSDKRRIMVLGFGLAGAGMLAIWILPATPLLLAASMLLYFIADTSFWTLIFSALADVTELDTLETGEDRGGVITSFVSLGTKLGYAIGMWLLGLGLDLVGYDQVAATTTQISDGIRMVVMVPIGLFHLACLVCMIAYPFSRKKYHSTKEKYHQ